MFCIIYRRHTIVSVRRMVPMAVAAVRRGKMVAVRRA